MMLLNTLTRRQWLCSTAGLALGMGVRALESPGLEAAWRENRAVRPPKARSVIFLYMGGGLTHIDTLDPKPERPAVQGPMEVIEGNTSGMRFGACLPKLAQQSKHLSLIRSMTTNQGAHEQGNYIMHTSYELRGTIRHPSMGAWASHQLGALNPELPSSILINAGSSHPGKGYLDMAHQPLRVDKPEDGLQHAMRAKGIDESRFQRRLAMLERFNSHHIDDASPAVAPYRETHASALRLMKSRDLEAFDLSKEPDALREAYGSNDFGQGCLLARRLVERKVRFVEVQLGGWDFHNDNFGRLDEKAPILDAGLSTLLEDLHQRGMLSDTLVVLGTEFGRTPTINNRELGRDHHPQVFSCLMAGAGIKGGHVHGSSDAEGREVDHSPVTPMDFNATIAHAMGMDLTKTIYSPSGRPFQVAHKGKPVMELFG